MNIPYHWLGDQSATVVAALETYEQRAREAYEIDLTDPQADE